MRSATLFSISIGLLTPMLLGAQASPQLVAGDTIRFRMVLRGPWEVHALRSLTDGVLVVDTERGAVQVPLSSVRQLQVRRQRHLDRRMALIGAGTGVAVGTMLPISFGATAEDAGGIAVTAAAFGLAGGALGGGGSRALRGGRNGFIIGGLAGALISIPLIEPCHSDWICFKPLDYVVIGGTLGGFAGGVVGAWVGALMPKSWESIPLARLSLAPTRDGGFAFSVSLGH